MAFDESQKVLETLNNRKDELSKQQITERNNLVEEEKKLNQLTKEFQSLQNQIKSLKGEAPSIEKKSKKD